MEFKLTVFGADKADFKLHGLGHGALNTTDVMYKILNDMFRVEAAVFSSQGRRGGGSWKRLKEATVKEKGSNVILIRKGGLLKSVTEKTDAMVVTNNTIEFGSDLPYAATHQFGRPEGNIPARPFIRFTGFDLNRWQTMIVSHIIRGFVNANK